MRALVHLGTAPSPLSCALRSAVSPWSICPRSGTPAVLVHIWLNHARNIGPLENGLIPAQSKSNEAGLGASNLHAALTGLGRSIIWFPVRHHAPCVFPLAPPRTRGGGGLLWSSRRPIAGSALRIRPATT
jgi:hypothetical protein